MEHFDDILLVDFVDSYANLTIKTVAMLRAFQELDIKAKFIFKVRTYLAIRLSSNSARKL